MITTGIGGLPQSDLVEKCDMDVQTDPILEDLTTSDTTFDSGVQTDNYLDQPLIKGVHIPSSNGVDVHAVGINTRPPIFSIEINFVNKNGDFPLKMTIFLV